MPCRGPFLVHLLMPAMRAAQSQGVEETNFHNIIPALAVDYLHDAGKDCVAQSCAVTMSVARWINLRRAGDIGDHTLIDIIIFTGIAVLLLNPVRVVQKMTRRDSGADFVIGNLEIGE